MKTLPIIAKAGIAALTLGFAISGFLCPLEATPVNDAFDNAIRVNGLPVSVTGSNLDASLESGEPLPSLGGVGASVWYVWTPAAAGVVQIDTIGSDFDSAIAVWTGNGFPEFSEVESDHGYNGGGGKVFVSVNPGTSYRIAVYGWKDNASAARGNLVLNIKSDPRSRIIGKVTGPDGVTPLEGVEVSASLPDGDGGWDDVEYAYTEPDGSYTMEGLSSGTYRVRFYSYNYAPEYYDNAASASTATDIMVGAAATVSGINASLGEWGRITGKVTGPDGLTPLEDVVVTAYVWDPDDEYWYSTRSAYTGGDGTYSMGNLNAGTYRLGFRDESGVFASEYYNNAAAVAAATDIVVGISTIVSGIDASLIETSSIAGKVTGPDGVTPLEGVGVSAYLPDGDDGWNDVAYAYTESDGSYTMGGLSPGTYRVGFYSSSHVGEYFNNTASISSATDVVVGAAAKVVGIDASLADLGRITGKVTGPDGTTPLEGIRVDAYVWDSGDEYWYSVRSVYTGGDGTYNLGRLGAGTYRLGFQDENGLHVSEYYNNVPIVSAAMDIVVGPSAAVSGIDASLIQTSRIRGNVTGPDGVTPLEDVVVSAYLPDGDGGWDNYVNETYTESDGTYTMEGLSPGTYRLRFYSYNHASEYYNNAASVATATDIVVGTAATVSGINASLAELGRITGKVTGPDGVTPLQGVEVYAYLPDGDGGWDNVDDVYTAADGTYSLGRLLPGTYRLGFSIYTHAPEYYDNAASLSTAADIVVGVAATVGGIDASLAELGRITGKVTGPDGVTPLEGVEVYAYLPDGYGGWDYVEGAYTGSDGTYTLDNLMPGTYRVRFSSYEYASEYYNNATSVSTAANIVVGAAATVGGINASLGELGSITGKVTGSDGTTPLEGIRVTVHAWDADDEYWDSVRSAYTGSDGIYTIGRLAAGNYRVGFSDESDSYAEEFYDNASSVMSSADVGVGSGSSVSGIDASLVQASRIAGKVTGPDGVTPLKYITVNLYRPDDNGGWMQVNEVSTKLDGTYLIRGLAAGVFRVGFFDWDYGIYAPEYYNNAANLASASDVRVGVATTVSGINAALSEYGHITGRVTGPDGVTPLEDIRVRAYVWDPVDKEWQTIGSAYTGSDGGYDLEGLTTGTYRVGFFDFENGNYAPEYYNNVPAVASATDILVSAGSTTGGVDASLVQASRMAGKVTGPDGIVPLEDVEVYAYLPDGGGGWRGVASTYTNSEGIYSIGGLVAGTYRVRFFDGGNYAEQYFNNSTSLSAATDIPVGVSVTVGGIDASLGIASRISGEVSDADGAGGLDDILVSLYQPDGSGGWNKARSAYSDWNGKFSFGGLAAGVYRVGFSDVENGHYADEYYNNSPDLDTAADVVVGAAATVSGIDASMSVDPPPAIGPDIEVETSLGIFVTDNGPAINLGTVNIGKAGATATFTIRNVGARDLAGLALSLKGANAGEIAIASPAVATLASGASTTFTAVLRPKSAGTKTAVLEIASNDPDENPFEIPLTGSGTVPPAPEIAVSEKAGLVDGKSTLNFGISLVRKAGVVKTITIRNIGTAPLIGLKVAKKGAQSSDFVVGKLKVQTLAPGASTTFKVTFKPSAKGVRSTALLISSNDANENPFDIRLKGTGKAKKSSAPAASPAMKLADREKLRTRTLQFHAGVDHIRGCAYRTCTILKESSGDASGHEVEVSSNLVDWFSGGRHTTVVVDNEKILKVRDNTPFTDREKRFMRLRADSRSKGALSSAHPPVMQPSSGGNSWNRCEWIAEP